MSRADDYRGNALTCRRLADAATDAAVKAALLEMARAWHALVDQAERNAKLDLVYEPAPVKAERQPATQQQPQAQSDKGPDENK